MVRVTIRHVWVSLASACPYQEVFRQVYTNLRGAVVASPVPQGS
jgi:hypothetical protein